MTMTAKISFEGILVIDAQTSTNFYAMWKLAEELKLTVHVFCGFKSVTYVNGVKIKEEV